MTTDTASPPLVCWSCGERIFGGTWVCLDSRPLHQSCYTIPATANAAEIIQLTADLAACRAALELLRQYANDSDEHQYGTLSTSLVRGIVDDALDVQPAARAILPSANQPGEKESC